MGEEKIKIDRSEFISWYFKLEDAHWVLEDIIYRLNRKGNYTVILDELFSQCIYIPSFLRTDYKSKIHKDDEYIPDECELV
jgi:hypothetical protein